MKSNSGFQPIQKCLLAQQKLFSASRKHAFLPFSLMTQTGSPAQQQLCRTPRRIKQLLTLHLGLLLTTTSANHPLCHQKQRQRGTIAQLWWPLTPGRCQRSTRQCRRTRYCPHVPSHRCRIRHYFNTVSSNGSLQDRAPLRGRIFDHLASKTGSLQPKRMRKGAAETNLL